MKWLHIQNANHRTMLEIASTSTLPAKCSYTLHRVIFFALALIFTLIAACSLLTFPNIIVSHSIRDEQAWVFSRWMSNRSTESLHLHRGLGRRQTSTVEVCKRWSHQSMFSTQFVIVCLKAVMNCGEPVLTKQLFSLAAVVNGTMYIFGGRSSSRAGQDSDTWSMRNYSFV